MTEEAKLRFSMPTLGPELFARLNARQHVGDRLPVVYGAPGLSAEDFSSIEKQLGFRLPEDFTYLFGNLQDPGGVMFPWATFRKQDYDRRMEWVWEGISFDVENGFWMDRWGERPEQLASALDLARKDFASWPKLLPIYSHRFLAAEPYRVGNPVFSIMQTDIIYYGSDLAHFLALEFLGADYKTHSYDPPIQRVEIWSDFAQGLHTPPPASPDDLSSVSRALRAAAGRR